MNLFGCHLFSQRQSFPFNRAIASRNRSAASCNSSHLEPSNAFLTTLSSPTTLFLPPLICSSSLLFLTAPTEARNDFASVKFALASSTPSQAGNVVGVLL